MSLRQANEDYTEEFDPSKYGMADSWKRGWQLHRFPEGFDSETNEWLEGYEKQREEWEGRYAEAERRHKMHTAQMEDGQGRSCPAITQLLPPSRVRLPPMQKAMLPQRRLPPRPVDRWPAMRSSLHFARSCRATPDRSSPPNEV